MRHLWTALLPLLCLGLQPLPSPAQQAEPSVAVGSRVRVVAPSAFRGAVSGRISRIGADTLFLAPRRDSLVAVPIAAITGTELSLGVDRWRGALRGAGTAALGGGALLGLLVFAGDPDCDYCLPGRDPEAAAAGAIIGAALFAPVGALVGAIHGFERWKPITPDFSIGFSPHREALSVGVILRIP